MNNNGAAAVHEAQWVHDVIDVPVPERMNTFSLELMHTDFRDEYWCVCQEEEQDHANWSFEKMSFLFVITVA